MTSVRHLISLLLMTALFSISQAQLNFDIKVENMNIPNLPGLQSYVVAQDANHVLLIGGRTDGLHKRRPFEAFAASGNNTNVYVLEMPQGKVYQSSLGALPQGLEEQLQSTNMQFFQNGNELVVIGGYAFSASNSGHITFPNISLIQVKEVINAVKNQQDISQYFTQITDERFRVTGGYLGYQNGFYYLAGGQNFEGRYNPMGPDHGPGFKQQYTNAVKKFSLDFENGITVTSYAEWKDSLNLHRRDYNLVAQIFPDGTKGHTMFSGVFQLAEDIPWLNCVDVYDTGYQVQDNHRQLLNQYHTAHIPVYEEGNNLMHTVFLGGIGQYYYDDQNNLVKDDNVPFVNTISAMSRAADGSMTESVFEHKMPALLGASAEFVPILGTNYFNSDGILLLDQLPSNTDLEIGYVIGGIQSQVPNGFFNNADMSEASTSIYKVLLRKNVNSVRAITDEDILDFEVFSPGSSSGITVRYRIPSAEEVSIQCVDIDGKLVYDGLILAPQSAGRFEMEIPTDQWSAGMYIVHINSCGYQSSKKIFVAN